MMDLCSIKNNSNSNLDHVIQLIHHFFPYAQKQLGFNKPVMVSFQSDEENANKLLGKTGYYNPDDFSIAIYVDGRHPKDVLRSLSHELVHHTQNCNGDFDSTEELGAGYAQENAAMRDAELDAYKRGNIIFRDFEDLIKKGKISVNIDFKKAGEPKMSLKEWKDNEINTLLMEKWGYGKKAKTLSEEDKEKIQEGEFSFTQSAPECDERKFPDGCPEEDLEEGWEHPKSATGTSSSSKAGRWDRGDVANKASGRWLKEGDDDELEEDCPPEGHEGGEAIDISGPGIEVHVDDISELSPEEAFAAGMAAAKDAIDQAIGGNAPPEGEGALDESIKTSITLDEARAVARRIFERIKETK